MKGKGTDSKPACHDPECNKKHAKEMHDLLTWGPTLVNTRECEEDEAKRVV
jgi:hypothetical protein